MRQLTATVCILVLSSCTAPTGSSPEVRAAFTLLRSEDPADRDRGEESLGKIAEANLREVWQLIGNSDPEVAARAYRTLGRLKLLPQAEQERRARELLEAIPFAEKEDRESLIDQLLSLGEWAMHLLDAELRNNALTYLEPTIVASVPGAPSVACVRIRNEGTVGAWIGVTENTRVVACAIRLEEPIFACNEEFALSPLFMRDKLRLREWLLGATRIPAGMTASVAELDPRSTNAMAGWCSIVSCESRETISHARREISVDGVSLFIPAHTRGTVWRQSAIVLLERTSKEFSAKAIWKSGKPGIQVSAKGKVPSLSEHFDVDHFWFVALSKCGEVLDFGPVREHPPVDSDAAWTDGETRTVVLAKPLPQGTSRVWLGMDWGSSEVVPRPLEVPHSDPAAELK